MTAKLEPSCAIVCHYHNSFLQQRGSIASIAGNSENEESNTESIAGNGENKEGIIASIASNGESKEGNIVNIAGNNESTEAWVNLFRCGKSSLLNRQCIQQVLHRRFIPDFRTLENQLHFRRAEVGACEVSDTIWAVFPVKKNEIADGVHISAPCFGGAIGVILKPS